MSQEPRRFSLANLDHLALFVGVLAHTGALCPKCGHGTRVTSKRWAKCKKCGERVERKSLPRGHMPISPENRARYPKDWREIRARIRARAGDRCEDCGVPNGAFIYRDDAGQWHHATLTCCADDDEPKVVRIVCTTAHLDHQPENCADENLRFWCQKCHLAYDRQLHTETAYRTRRRGRAARDLFEESVP